MTRTNLGLAIGIGIAAEVNHYPDLSRPALAITATDAARSAITLFFSPHDDMSELDRAEAWLLEALGKVTDAKIAALPRPCRATNDGYICTLTADHAGVHEAWGGGELPELTWTIAPFAAIGEPIDLVAVDL